jgi:hypothetical protein
MRWYYEATGGAAGHELGFKAITYWAMVGASRIRCTCSSTWSAC